MDDKKTDGRSAAPLETWGDGAVAPAPGDGDVLQLWMRLLHSTTHIESEVRERLQSRFGISLARFDYLSQLSRVNAAMRLVDLSRLMRIVGGNLSQITEELEREGWVKTDTSAANSLLWSVRLTAAGRAGFDEIAGEHERWIRELFAGFDSAAVRDLYAKLGELRGQPAPTTSGSPSTDTTAP